MSRSFKKHPVIGNCGNSDKYGKTLSSRRLRQLVRVAIKNEDEIMPLMREISSVWNFSKDGKQWIDDDYQEFAIRK